MESPEFFQGCEAQCLLFFYFARPNWAILGCGSDTPKWDQSICGSNRNLLLLIAQKLSLPWISHDFPFGLAQLVFLWFIYIYIFIYIQYKLYIYIYIDNNIHIRHQVPDWRKGFLTPNDEVGLRRRFRWDLAGGCPFMIDIEIYRDFDLDIDIYMIYVCIYIYIYKYVCLWIPLWYW